MTNNISKFDDIEAVMKRAEKALAIIESEYNKQILKQTINDNLLGEIKDYLGNLRSTLDFLWHKIPKSRNNFPICVTLLDYQKRVYGLDQEYIKMVSKWQPFNGQDWIQWFSILNNTHKHLTLVPQIRKEIKEFSIKKDGGGITAQNCIYRGNVCFRVDGIRVPVNEMTQFPVDVPGVDIERKIWVDFLFDAKNISELLPEGISVLPFLKLCFDKIKIIISEVEKLL